MSMDWDLMEGDKVPWVKEVGKKGIGSMDKCNHPNGTRIKEWNGIYWMEFGGMGSILMLFNKY